MIISDYQVVESISTERLAKAVNELLAQGYSPLGGIVIHTTVHSTWYMQSMCLMIENGEIVQLN